MGAGRADRVAGRAAHDRHARPSTACGSRDFFKPFKPLADITGGDRDVGAARSRSRSRRCSASALLTEVDTYTYRTAHVMLSTAQSYRPGDVRASSTTSGRRRSTSTRSSSRRIRRTSRSRARSGPTTTATGPATGSLPRAAQHGARRRSSLYAPQFAHPGSAARRVRLPRLHARVLPAGALRRGRAARAAGRSAARATATSRCGRGGPTQWRTYDRPGDLHARARRSRSTSSPTAAPTTSGSPRSATDRRSARSASSGPRSGRAAVGVVDGAGQVRRHRPKAR